MVAIVQSKRSAWVGGGTGFTTTFTGAPTGANTLIALLWSEDQASSTIDTAGWTLVESATFSGGQDSLAVWQAPGTAGSNVHVANLSGAANRRVHIFEVSGGVDVHGSATTTFSGSGTITGPTRTPSAAGILIAGIIGRNPSYAGIATVTPTAPLAVQFASDKTSRVHDWSGTRSVTAAAVTPTVGIGGADFDSSWGTPSAGMVMVALVAAAPTSPVASFTGTPLTGVGSCNTTFTDTSTNTPTSWSWTFGDGGTSTSQNPTHNYTSPGTYSVSLTATNASGSGSLTRTAYVVVAAIPSPGAGFEWDGLSFTNERVREWTITRGASAELTGGSQPGSMTIVLINSPDDRYNPENTGGDLYGFLHDGPRVWVGVNEDGTVTYDAGKTVYGLFAGNITDLSLIPEAGANVAPKVEIVCADPLEWFSRQKVRIPDATSRMQYDLRVDVLTALGVPYTDLAVEPSTLPLSRADGFALNILDAINGANGTRHFAKPADSAELWYTYTTVRRTELLDGTSDAALDAGADHVTGTSGFRVSADGVINQQKASVEPIAFPGRVLVWQPDLLPMNVTGTVEVWAEFGDYVGDPIADIDYTGSSLTSTLEPFGDTAKLTLVSSGTSSITSFDITGYLVQRGSTESVVIDDLTSQAEPRGVRAGPDLTGDYLGTLTSAHGFASHIVWRFGNHLYRPTVTVENWFPEMFDLDLFDRISLTVAELSITDRIFEIVGLTLHSDLAALDKNGNPVTHHTATYVLQESRVQSPFGWFTLDDSLLDDTDVLAY